MNKTEILELAKIYMNNRKVDIVLPGQIGKKQKNKIEVIFLNPIALEPGVIICPPDNRVWVDVKTKEVTWIEQM